MKFRYEERDLAGALRATMLASLRKRPQPAVAAIVLACALAYLTVATTGATRVIVLGLAATLVALVVASFVVVPKMMFRRASLRVPMAVDACDEGLTIIAGPKARTIAWGDVVRVEHGARVIIVRHGEEALIVPRRAFRNRDRERDFVELLARYASRDMRALDSGKSTPSANA